MTDGIHVGVAGRSFLFEEAREITIGRDSSSSVRLVSPYVSRHHGRLVPEHEGWIYEDVGSRRGTYRDGARVDRLIVNGPVTLLLGEPGRGEEMRLIPQSSGPVFISYRREDAAGHAGRLHDGLAWRLGTQVFLDVDDMVIGEDFLERVVRTIQSSRVVLVVIGPTWLSSEDRQGKRRLDDPRDPVRHEVASALAQGNRVTVIPVLMAGAIMPGEDDLSEDLQPLARRHAFQIRDERWKRDLDDLSERLGALLRRKPSPTVGSGE